MKPIDKFAELVVRTGVNIQENQTLVISAPIGTVEFVRLCQKKAYEFGAKEVVIKWYDDICMRDYYLYAAEEALRTPDYWRIQMSYHYSDQDAAFLSIYSDDPEVMKDVNPERMMMYRKAYAKPMEAHNARIMSNKNAWCVVSVPTEGWARKVFPDLTGPEAVEKLWHAIFEVTRVNEDDPVAAWAKHQANLNQKLDVLNSQQFSAFKYKNSLGTDLIVEMPENHIWFGGADQHIPKGYDFVANMPTEEIFSAPKYNGVNGKVVASYPLVHNGKLIEGMWFVFKDGVVTDYGADTGQEILDEVFKIDEGAKRLGEIALVPYNSPISNMGILFYDTLFDENAACHFAFGKAYPVCVKGGEDMDAETLLKNGVNDSETHIDFMVGTKDLDIIGVKSDGTEVQIFHEGNFVI